MASTTRFGISFGHGKNHWFARQRVQVDQDYRAGGGKRWDHHQSHLLTLVACKERYNITTSTSIHARVTTAAATTTDAKEAI